MQSQQFSRRQFLRLSAMATTGVVVAACGAGSPAPEATVVPPTRAETVAQPTVPAGPPSQYNEAPMLKDLVDAGQLPPVGERLPNSPLVLDVAEEIGQYGGTLRRAYKGVSDRWGPNKVIEEFLIEWRQPEGGELSLAPHICERYELNDDATEYTFHLRQGMKWSDGQPLTTEDVRFWYEDLYMNEALATAVGGNEPSLMPGGEKMQIEIVDDYTFRTRFAIPNPLLSINIARGVGCHGSRGPNFCTPAHYMKQFHPDYASQAEIDAALEKYQMTDWSQLMESFNSPAVFWFLNPDVPTVHPWITKEAPPANRIVYERNPYYWQVDAAGNQLPYIDEMTHDLFESNEVLNFKIINGEIDCQNRHVEIGNYTLFKENEEKSGYRTLIWRDARTYAYHVNISYDKDPILHDLFNDVRFRHALSVAIDRFEINNLAFSGLAEPRQACPVSGSPQYDAEWETKWIEFEQETANQLLDEIGLTERDADGFRLRSDGETLTLILEFAQDALAGPVDMHELVKDYWEQVGIKVILNAVERTLYETHNTANELQFAVWTADRSAVIPADPSWYTWGGFAGHYGRWYTSKGANGIEPPADHPVRQIWALWEEAIVTASESARNDLLQQMLNISKENIWSIGTVGEPPALFIAKNELRNVPSDLINDDPLRGIGLAQPQQFFFKSS